MKISIVTVCLNAAETLEETLRSVAAQDWPDLEHVVIDGGSTDGTLDIVARYGRDNLILFSESDDGIYDAMNRGLARATGDFVGFLNADDFFIDEGAVSHIATRLAVSGADCAMAGVLFVDRHGRYAGGRHYKAAGFRRWWLRIGVMPPHPGFYVRASLARALGGFDLRYRIASDFDFVARAIIGRRARWTTIDRPLVCFRVGGLTTSAVATKRLIGAEIAHSLAALGQPLAKWATILRYPFKLLQFAPVRGGVAR